MTKISSQTMYEINDDSWPIIIIRMDGPSTIAFMEHFLDTWSACLSRKEPFGMLYLFEGTDRDHPSEVKRMQKRWLDDHRPEIGTYMAGIAMVVKAPAILKFMRPIASTYAQKVFGCPAKVFEWEEKRQAREWLETQLEDIS